MSALLAPAFIAGLVATVNPCGFAMLPAYLSFFLGSEEDLDTSRSMGRSLRIAGTMTASFLVVFGIAGVLLAAGLQVVVDALPWLALVVGAAIVGLGVYVIRGGVIALHLPGTGKVNRKSVFAFGVSYAVASLSCTLPIFLSLVVGSIATATFATSLLLFIVYGLGMGLVIGAITVGLAFGRDRVVRLTRSAGRWLGPVSGAVLILAGLFIIWYWATLLTRGAAVLGELGLVQLVDQASSAITDFVRRNALWVTLGLVGLVVAVATVLGRGPASGPAGERAEETPGGSGETGAGVNP